MVARYNADDRHNWRYFRHNVGTAPKADSYFRKLRRNHLSDHDARRKHRNLDKNQRTDRYKDVLITDQISIINNNSYTTINTR